METLSEMRARAGHIGGTKTMQLHPELHRIGGFAAYRKLKSPRKFHRAGYRKAIEMCPDFQRKGDHVRWHVNRGITKPGCIFCEE